MNTTSGCKAVDVSRSAFECWRAHPEGDVLVPRRGSYYFLDPGAPFVQRSELGGWWFEGRGHFQSGRNATLPSPDPFWVNGAIPTGPEWPLVQCCRLLFPLFTPTRATKTVTRASDGATDVQDADIVGFSSNTYLATWDLGFQFIDVAVGCNPTSVPEYVDPCNIDPVILRVFIDPAIVDPLYRFSSDSPLSFFHSPTLAFPNSCVNGYVRVDWFGTLP